MNQMLDNKTPGEANEFTSRFNISNIEQDYDSSELFLKSYAGSADTFTAYRREVERLLQWSWLIEKKSIRELDRNDLRRYVEFANHPPLTWITTKAVSRFINQDGKRVPNPKWRPFVARIAKSQHKQGETANPHNYHLTHTSLQALFSVLSTFFTFLQQEGYVTINPVQLIRQKSRFLQKQQSQKVTRRLSTLQWETVITYTQTLADEDPDYERHLFMLAAFYLLGLRISELAETPGRTPSMGDFAPDKHSRWWFTTVGKGNKQRDVAVPDSMLLALKRYRLYLGLTPLPTRGESTPLLHKQRGHGGLGTRQIRNLVQKCFDCAIVQLHQCGKEDEAQDLAAATVHWLRHTAISADVEHRPREHVRDDAGHENASITDRYIDTDRAARHESARLKALKPKIVSLEK